MSSKTFFYMDNLFVISRYFFIRLDILVNYIKHISTQNFASFLIVQGCKLNYKNCFKKSAKIVDLQQKRHIRVLTLYPKKFF